MIGDTPYDVAAARKAGVRVVAFRCGGWIDPDLVGAIEVYDGPWDLLARLDSSVLA
jgi:phosphoglycolate phosphatase-like HAD superfamily hydrolase